MRSIRVLTGLALASAALVMSVPSAQAVSPSCQQALDDAEITQRNADTVNADPNTSAADKKAATDEANQAASTAQRFCDSTDPAVRGSVHAGEGGTQTGTDPAALAGAAALLAAGAGAVYLRRRDNAGHE
ncbi:hypothetical protein G3I40_04200 [Streptomyces sp. SID14478]|uniref:hypothetical protein n=1 Tax=Streptomyces sp. SID14478 TaxID=2706073 RepID=UPI0013D8FB03|nr:hypothetical protein [Streptomyces sp. SID14478]NEB73657.1 hypothetical protein [Streptomyces sp. SID14478]NEB74435.1 hypothetical protein [Streptomyces sp. SID14478]